MVDHFKDPKSQGQQPWWNFNVVFDNQPAVHELVRKYTPALNHPGLYSPVPTKWLHATILAVGPVSDYSEPEMMAIVELLGTKLQALRLPKFEFDSWLDIGGIALHISPQNQFTKIYDCVSEAVETVVGSARTRRSPHGNFLAHMTLAYAAKRYSELDKNRLFASHPVQPVVFTGLNLALIKQYPKAGHYEWIILKELPIGTAKPE